MKVLVDNQQIRNLTTGIVHTEMKDIYTLIEMITGEKFMTHQLPAANKAIRPFLEKVLKDERFFEDKLDTTHTRQTKLKVMGTKQKKLFAERYGKEAETMFLGA